MYIVYINYIQVKLVENVVISLSCLYIWLAQRYIIMIFRKTIFFEILKSKRKVSGGQ